MKTTQPSILIINVHSTLNAGDLSLLEATIQQLKLTFESPRIIVSANYPEEPYYQENEIKVVPSPWWLCGVSKNWSIFKQITLWLLGSITSLTFKGRLAPQSWQRLLKAYSEANLVVGVSGNQFYSGGRYGWPLPLTILSVQIAHHFAKPFYTMPQSIGPLRHDWERKWIKSIYQKARIVFVRDQESLNLAQSIGLSTDKIIYSPDPAFLFQSGSSTEATRILQRWGGHPNKPAIGITILANMGRSLKPGHINHYYKTMVAIIEKLTMILKAQVFIFLQVTGPSEIENDRTGAYTVLQQLNSHTVDSVHIVDERLSPQLLKACYGKMDLFIATRLHSGIFALGMGVPTIFIGYLTKTRGMMKSLDLEDWMIQIDEIDAEQLWNKITTAWIERGERTARLAQQLPEVCQGAKYPAVCIAQDYQNHDR